MGARMIPVDQIARFCHEANRVYCRSIGDTTQLAWADAPEWQKASAIQGVEWVLQNPHAPESAVHESWLAAKIADGWRYGEVKDPLLKTHPCLRPYDELPVEQTDKDRLFKAIVMAFRSVA